MKIKAGTANLQETLMKDKRKTINLPGLPEKITSAVT
jgi:hypothetical protein